MFALIKEIAYIVGTLASWAIIVSPLVINIAMTMTKPKKRNKRFL